jgi:hypothetical protein
MSRTKLYSAMVVIFTIALLSSSLGSTSAAPDIRQYGPFHGVSPDSGTCGNVWANDKFNRYFTVSTTPNLDGTYTVTLEFRQGAFETIAGPSPGACELGTNATVGDGIKGKFSGTFTIIVSGGTYNADAKPGPGTTAASFVSDVFGTTATYVIPAFSLEYSTANNGSWINSSAGNAGDITGTR